MYVWDLDIEKRRSSQPRWRLRIGAESIYFI